MIEGADIKMPEKYLNLCVAINHFAVNGKKQPSYLTYGQISYMYFLDSAPVQSLPVCEQLRQ